MGLIQSLFGKVRQIKSFQNLKELGGYNSRFSSFGLDMYKSELVRSCIRPLAEHSSKANPVCSNKQIEKILQYNPNIYMNGKEFLYKIRTILEIKNTAFIFIKRDIETLKVIGFYPVPWEQIEALESGGNIYIKFYFANGTNTILPWADLAVIRKDYFKSDVVGDGNDAILQTLEVINTVSQGLANAVKSTSNLRGIIKSTKSMLDGEDLKKQKDNFVKDYLSIANEGGIASLDANSEFTPIKMEPITSNAAQLKELRENIYRYFGVNEKIVQSSYTESEFEAFYESKIEPFLVALSLELTRKVFTERELGFGNVINFESNRLQYASTKTKLALVQMVDRGALTPNEWRLAFNLSKIEGGDKPIRRLDTATVEEAEVIDEEGKEEEKTNE